MLVGSEAVSESERNLIRLKEGGEARFDLALESLANQYVSANIMYVPTRTVLYYYPW